MGRTVALKAWPPRRIVSLVPSQTELLHDLGLGSEVVGITLFCIHPDEWFRHKTRVGGTKTINVEKIAALEPDLIIGNKEENERAHIESLEGQFPVWMSDVGNLNEAFDMIGQVGALTGKADTATAMVRDIRTAFETMRAGSSAEKKPPVAYLIWRKPYMVAGSDTFIHEMLVEAGFSNAFGHKTRYPEISLRELGNARPDLIFLSTEPYPFAEKHLPAFREVCPETRIAFVDGELFSWYGSRLLQAPDYFLALRKSLNLA